MVGVGAVVWDGSRVLLVRRGKPPARDTWSLPGGLVELGETAADAVRREVREECGIEVEVADLLGVFEPVFREPDGRIRYHYVVLDYLAHCRDGELRVGDDAAEARWVAPEALAEYALTPAVREMVGRALARVGRAPE
jgi:mutator protein MutT